MSYHTPPGWNEKCTFRDDSAAHQIRLAFSHGQINVSCTCRTLTGHGAGTANFVPIATITTADEAWEQWYAYHDRAGLTPTQAVRL